jgi:DNA polymerase V
VGTPESEKMCRQNLAACRLMVFVQTNPFRTQDAQYSREQTVQLPVATVDTGKIVRAARLGLNATWRAPARLLLRRTACGRAVRPAP